MRLPVFVCLSVCHQDYSKTREWIWMKCCVWTDVGTWTNWLTFEPDPDYSPDAGTGLPSPISYALQRGILRRENPTYRPTYWRGPTLQRRVVLEWFYSVSRRNNFVGGTCALPSALLVFCMFQSCLLLYFWGASLGVYKLWDVQCSFVFKVRQNLSSFLLSHFLELQCHLFCKGTQV